MLDRNAEIDPPFRFAPASDPTDPISELLMGMRLRGASYGKLRFSPPFGVGFPQIAGGRFHFVAVGSLHLKMPDGEAIQLNCGDAVLLPRGDGHALVSQPGVTVRAITAYDSRPLCAEVCAVSACDEGSCRTKDALIFTSDMTFELDTLHPLVGVMPRVMTVGALGERQPEILPLLEAMEREMACERAGTAGILARLADVVAASIVRGWVERGCGHSTGWVEALRDPRIGRVIAALHRDPGRDWTVAEMAAGMGSSRSVFAERFTTLTGTTPLRYVAVLRMRLARQWLSRDRMAIDQVARQLGYGSQAAFSRAYKRITGHPPGQTRVAGRA